MIKVNVEPVIFFYTITMTLSNSLNTNLLLYKTCDPTGAMKNTAGSKCDNEAAAQHVVASINEWKLLIIHSVPIAVSLVASTWSDQHGRRRRPLIMLPIVGQILSDVMSLYCAVDWSMSPQVTAAVQAIATAFTGTLPLIFNGLNMYVADITVEERLTVKFGVFNAMAIFGAMLGTVVYGTLITYVGIVPAYAVAVGLGLVALLLLFVFINNPPAADPTAAEPYSLYTDVLRTLNPMNVFRNCYRVLTKRRNDNGTTVLWLAVFVCAPLTCVPKEGESISFSVPASHQYSGAYTMGGLGAMERSKVYTSYAENNHKMKTT